MQKKTPDELKDVQLHQFLASIPVIPPLERHPTVFKFQYPPIGDGNTVDVSAQVLKDVFDTAERLLAVGDPFSLVQFIFKPVKRRL